MKKLLVIAAAAVATLFTGCTPSADQIKATATAIGTAAGLVANQTEISDAARNATVQVLGEVRECVPAAGQTFADAWSPIIDAKIAEIVKAGKLDATAGVLVKTVAVMAAQAIDYTFDVRFPKAKQYEELIRAGTSGVIDGFLAVFKSANLKSATKTDYDKEAYEYFQKKFAK